MPSAGARTCSSAGGASSTRRCSSVSPDSSRSSGWPPTSTASTEASTNGTAPARAEAYARALWRVLALVSVRGSIHYRVLPGTAPRAVPRRAPSPRAKPGLPRRRASGGGRSPSHDVAAGRAGVGAGPALMAHLRRPPRPRSRSPYASTAGQSRWSPDRPPAARKKRRPQRGTWRRSTIPANIRWSRGRRPPGKALLDLWSSLPASHRENRVRSGCASPPTLKHHRDCAGRPGTGSGSPRQAATTPCCALRCPARPRRSSRIQVWAHRPADHRQAGIPQHAAMRSAMLSVDPPAVA